MKWLYHPLLFAERRHTMVEGSIGDWRSVVGDCSGCPRSRERLPLLLSRDVSSLKKVRFVVISQEPAFALRAKGRSAEQYLISLCKEAALGTPAYVEAQRAQPLGKIISIFGTFDPAKDDVYWTHALKCCPTATDRDITKEWRKAGKVCAEHIRAELERIGQDEINILAIGKYATEMCLYLFDDQDIDQDLSISEVMQGNKLPLGFQVKWKSGRSQRFNLYLFTNPGKDVCTVQRKGGKMTVDEIQELEAARIRELRNK
jgi:hypothetical protein